MKSRLPGLLLCGLAGFLALTAPPTRAQQQPAGRPGATGPATPGGAPATGKDPTLPDLGLVGWSIPPIRWGGNTGSTYIYNTDFLGNSSLSQTELVSGRAASFIYAPWFAQVNLNAGLSTSGATSKSSGASSKSKSTTINYGGVANVFPMSRFPFSAFLDFSDSRAKAGGGSAGAATAQYDSMRMGVRQTYRPETGNHNFNGSADRSVVTSSNIRSIVNAFQGGYSTNLEDHALAANARFSSTTGDAGGQGSTLFGATGSHNWSIPDEGLNINSSLNFSRNDLKTLSPTGGGLTTNNSQIMQANSSFNWLPDEELPLNVSGGVGLLNTTTATDVEKTSLLSLNSFANASYRFSNNLMGSAGATIASTGTTGSGLSPGSTLSQRRLVMTTQSASLSYSGNPLSFENFSYNWGTSGNISNTTNSQTGASRLFGGSAQHSVSRNITLSETSLLSLSGSQSIGLSAGSGGGTSNRNTLLTHNLGAVWRANVGPVSVATASLNAYDTLSSGSYSNHLRSLSGNGNFQTQFSARASLGASANFTLSQQLSSPNTTTATNFGTTTTSTPSNWTGSGQVYYSHRSPFDISNLVYTASFLLSASQSNLRVVTGDANATSWQVGKVINNQATYRVGRLAFQANASIAWSGDGKKNATVFGSISRDIGDF